MVPPPCIGRDVKILRLDKGLYGLRTASLPWFKKLFDKLAEIGFISQAFNACVFISADHKICDVVDVDNITTAGSRSDIYKLIDHLHSRFKITVKGGLQYILVIQIKHIP